MLKYLLKAPDSTWAATSPAQAKAENLKIKYKTIIVEGAGGVYVPLVRNKYFIFNLF